MDASGQRLRRTRALAWWSGGAVAAFLSVLVVVASVSSVGLPSDWSPPGILRPSPSGSISGGPSLSGQPHPLVSFAPVSTPPVGVPTPRVTATTTTRPPRVGTPTPTPTPTPEPSRSAPSRRPTTPPGKQKTP